MKSFKALIGGAMFAMLLGLISCCFSLGNNSVCYADVMGGKIYIVGGASYTLSGGTITSPRKVDYGGGVILGQGSTFTLAGGEIINNTAVQMGGGVYTAGTMKMTSGSVSDNSCFTGGGVYVASTGNFNFSDGIISFNTGTYWGGGVYAVGGFTLGGGAIYNNTSSDSGGGVFVSNSMTMRSGSIYNNKTAWGGGIYDGGEFTMSGGDIHGNTVSDAGGGIYIWNTATMTAGSIYSNEAKYGGGVYVATEAIFNLKGGYIRDNRATTSGGGIYIDGTVNMSGGEISGNTASFNNAGGIHISPGATLNYSDGTISDDIYLESATSSLILKKSPTSKMNIRMGYGLYYTEWGLVPNSHVRDGTKIAKLSGITTLDLTKFNIINNSPIGVDGARILSELVIRNIDNEYWIVMHEIGVEKFADEQGIGGGQESEYVDGTIEIGAASDFASCSSQLQFEDIDLNVGYTSEGLVASFYCDLVSSMLPNVSLPDEEFDGKVPKVERGALSIQEQAVLDTKKFYIEPVKADKVA